MVKNTFFKIFIFFSIFSIQIGGIFAQGATPTGITLADNVFEELQNMDLKNAKRIPLSTAAFENFPYNIEVEIPAKASTQDFIIAATQEDFFEHKEFFAELLQFAKEGVLNFNLHFVFTAGDRRRISGNEKTLGTEFFCRSTEGAQSTHALILDFSATKKTFVTPGGAGEVSPLYLTRPLCNSLNANSVDYTLAGGIYLSLYNLGVFKSDARLSAFLSRAIPAVMLGMLGKKKDYAFEINSIKEFLQRLELSENINWSRHYIPIKMFSKLFWMTEKQMLIILMVFTTICLLIVSDFAFLFRRKSRRLVEIKMRALKSNYLIFLTAAIIAFSLFVGQTFAHALQNAGVKNLMLLFVLKVSLPFFIVTLLYPIEIRFHKNMPPYIYEYILTISALLNIFIFSIIDISLFFLFAFEYLILALSRTVKRTAFLYLFMFAFLIPFMPLLHSILIYSDGQKINELIFCSFHNNAILSFIFVPLSLLWLRVLARLKSKSYSAKRTAVFFFIFSTVCIAGIAIISTITIFILNRFFFRNVEPQKRFMRIENASAKTFSAEVYDSEYYGGKIRCIEISSHRNAERYSVFVEGQSSNTVYFSIYETFYENGKTEFLLPENPPQKLTITYTPDSSENSVITIESYFINENSQNAKKETLVFDISGEEISERAK